jgi:hypothetical protein
LDIFSTYGAIGPNLKRNGTTGYIIVLHYATGFKKISLQGLGTRFEAKNCISEPCPQEAYRDISLKHPVLPHLTIHKNHENKRLTKISGLQYKPGGTTKFCIE